MKVYLNRIDGIDDGIVAMFISKRHLTRELEMRIRNEVYMCSNQAPTVGTIGALVTNTEDLSEWLTKFCAITRNHITLGRMVDLSFTVYDIHRGGQDDLDSHAKRMNNRIVRSSTRLADFRGGEMSEFYEGKIVPTDVALEFLGINTPDEIEYGGKTYVKAANGYVLKGHENDRDYKRGLYMLSLPSTFSFKIDLTEFAHMFKERNMLGTANPEVKDSVEEMAQQLCDSTFHMFNRDLLNEIKN